jgi:hypothetical protein
VSHPLDFIDTTLKAGDLCVLHGAIYRVESVKPSADPREAWPRARLRLLYTTLGTPVRGIRCCSASTAHIDTAEDAIKKAQAAIARSEEMIGRLEK